MTHATHPELYGLEQRAAALGLAEKVGRCTSFLATLRRERVLWGTTITTFCADDDARREWAGIMGGR